MKVSHEKDSVQRLSESTLVKQYIELTKLCPNNMKMTERPLPTLKQPSLFEEVDSITTYDLNNNI